MMEQELTDLTKNLLGISCPMVIRVYDLNIALKKILIEELYKLLSNSGIQYREILRKLDKDGYNYIHLSIEGYTEIEFIKTFIPRECTFTNRNRTYIFRIGDFEIYWQAQQGIFRRILIDGE